MIDGIESKIYDQIREIKFSSDGKRILFVGIIGNQAVAVIDGVESRPYDRVYDIDFS